MGVEFQHPRPSDTSEHERIFQCELRFGAAANSIVFDSASLAQPISKADPLLSAVLGRHAEELLVRHPKHDSLTDQVRSVIRGELNGGDPSLETTATHLGLTARTLQRKLNEPGTSHNELLDQLRRELALKYLEKPEMAICEVAYLLGFSEPSAFHRAFKRWTGKTPRQFRSG